MYLSNKLCHQKSQHNSIIRLCVRLRDANVSLLPEITLHLTQLVVN